MVILIAIFVFKIRVGPSFRWAEKKMGRVDLLPERERQWHPTYTAGWTVAADNVALTSPISLSRRGLHYRS